MYKRKSIIDPHRLYKQIIEVVLAYGKARNLKLPVSHTLGWENPKSSEPTLVECRIIVVTGDDI